MTSKVNGKIGILTPYRCETPENFITKIGHINYTALQAVEARHHAYSMLFWHPMIRHFPKLEISAHNSVNCILRETSLLNNVQN